MNLKSFLYTLPFEKTVSVGDCVRNKSYRVTHFPKRKSDSVDSLSLARFAVLEQPGSAEKVPVELSALRDIGSRLEAQAREVTRHLNQLHNVLSRVFPEFDTIVRELNAKSMSIESRRQLRVGASYPFRIHEGSESVALDGVVKWCRLRRMIDIGGGESQPLYQAGIAFSRTVDDFLPPAKSIPRRRKGGR